MTALMPLPKQQFFSSIGTPLNGGKLYTYAAGTTDPKATYTDSAGTIPQTNPIVLNARGEPNSPIYWSGAYKIELRDVLGNVIYTVDNYIDTLSVVNTALSGLQLPDYAALRAYKDDQKMVYVTGYLATAAPSGIAGSFTRDDSDTTSADNGGTIIIDSLGRRWKRAISDNFYFEWFGVTFDGVTDDHTALQATLTAAGALTSARVSAQSRSGTAKSSAGLTWDVSRVAVDFNGKQIDFSGMAAGNMISFTQSEMDPNLRPLKAHAHPLSNFIFIGPGMAVTAVTCFNLADTGAPNTLSGLAINNGAVLNCANDVVFGAGAFCNTFYKVNFNRTAGVATTYSVTAPPATNAGERNEFIACKWTNRDLVFNQSNPNATTYFSSCSLDYFSARAITVSGGSVFINHGHVESNTDADYWFSVTNQSAALHLAGVQLNLLGNKTAFALFYSDASVTHGGVILDDVTLSTSSPFTAPLIGGTGRAVVGTFNNLANTTLPVIGQYLNALANGDFESANALSEWTLSGAPAPSRSNTVAHAGAYSLKFAGAPGNSPAASKTMAARAGQHFSGELYYQATGLTGSSGTFYIEVDWLDSGGNVLSSNAALAITNDVAAWTRQVLTMAAPAPKGTANLRVAINIFGVAAGAPTAYIDDVILNVV